jgi:hypothetical protein
MDIYLIKWIDAYNVRDIWLTKEELEEEIKRGYEVVSVGILFKEEGDYITILQNHGNNDKVSGIMNIPVNCIIEKIKIHEIEKVNIY